MSNWSPTSYIDAALTALLNEPLSAEAVADKIVEECTAAVRNATAEADQDNEDTPGLESFLWGFWCEFHKIAQEDTTTHRRLGQVLVALKVKGDESCKGWQVWGSPISWSDLPIFGATARECIDTSQIVWVNGRRLDMSAVRTQATNSPPCDNPDAQAIAQGIRLARTRCVNMNAFLAYLWAADVADEAFYGIATMRMCLEPFSRDATPAGAKREGEAGAEYEPPELQLELAAVWLKIAGAQMLACKEIFGPNGNPNWKVNEGCPGGSGGTWQGVDGYHPDRWAHWKGILRAVAGEGWDENVIRVAQETIKAMEIYEQLSAESV